MNKVAVLFFYPFIRCFLISQSEKIINACVVILSELYKHFGRQWENAVFILTVCVLAYMKICRKLTLFFIIIFTKISDIFINHMHHQKHYTISDYQILTFIWKSDIIEISAFIWLSDVLAYITNRTTKIRRPWQTEFKCYRKNQRGRWR